MTTPDKQLPQIEKLVAGVEKGAKPAPTSGRFPSGVFRSLSDSLRSFIRHGGKENENAKEVLIGGSTLPSPEHPGHNEDRTIAEKITVNGKEIVLLGVFDGMGGHDGGEAAAKTAQTTVQENVVAYLQRNPNAPASDVQKYVMGILELANNRINKLGRGSFHDPGTTASVAVMLPTENGTYNLVWANVGDSRITIWDSKAKKLIPVSRDHNLLRSIESQGGVYDFSGAINSTPAIAGARDMIERCVREAEQENPSLFRGNEITLSLSQIDQIATRLDAEEDPTTFTALQKLFFALRARIFASLGGGHNKTLPDTGIQSILPGQTVLLTSDGVDDVLTRSQKERILATNHTPQRQTNSLLAATPADHTPSKLLANPFISRAKRDDRSAVAAKVPLIA